MIKRPAIRTALIVLLAAMPQLVLAKDSSPPAGGKSDKKSIYQQYYSSVEAMQAEHRQKLADIDKRYSEAMREYSAENVKRSKALATDHSAAHKALGGKNLSGAEKQAEYRKIQKDNTERRKNHAEWRDTTTSRLNEEYHTARRAEIDRHKQQMDRLLAERNDSLAISRAASTRVALPPDVSSLGDDENEDAGTADREHLGRGEGSQIAEVRTGDSIGGSGNDTDSLARDDDGQAGIGRAPSSAAPGGDKSAKTAGGTVRRSTDSGVDVPVRDSSGEYYEYGDGSRVQAVGADGSVGKVNDKGDIVYGDGTTVVHTGDQEVTVHRPDGSSTTRRVNDAGAWETTDRRSADDYPSGSTIDAPVRDADGSSFEYGDGTRVQAVGPDGSVGKVNDKGDIVYGDGTTVVHTGDQEVTIHRPDGSSTTRRVNDAGAWETTDRHSAADQAGGNAPVRDAGGTSFVFGDGTRVQAMGPDGSVGKVNDKGDIVYGDGTTVVHTGDQEVTIHRPDGSSTTRRVNDAGAWETTDRRSADDYPSGSTIDAPVRDADGTSFEYGDGTRVQAVGPDGSVGKINDKGDIVYGDGTTVVHTGDQQVTVHRPDGSSTTRQVNEDGQWQTVGHNKPYSEGSGSNDKYGSGSGAGGSSSSESASGSSGGGSSGDSGSSSDSSSDDSSDEGKDSSSGNDSDESGSAEGESGDSGSSESADDADAEGEGKEYYGESGSGRQTGPSDIVQGIVDRATGQSTEVESAVPEPCTDSGGFGVTQPGVGGTGSCVPGHLPTISEDNDQQPASPDAGSSADNEDLRRAGSTDLGGRITQPGLGEDGFPVEDLPSQSALDQSPVVNPPPD